VEIFLLFIDIYGLAGGTWTYCRDMDVHHGDGYGHAV
jgi:hypothetical protein